MAFSAAMARWAEQQINTRFQRQFCQPLPLQAPQTFREKLLVRMVRLQQHWRCTTRLSDKLAVRKYVLHCVGAEYLSTICWAGNKPEQAPLEDYCHGGWIAKTNHGCGGHRLITPGDQRPLRQHLQQQLQQNYYWLALEAQYFHIQPQLYIEQLVQGQDQAPALTYGLWCFAGRAELIQVDDGSPFNPFYNREWRRLNFSYRHGIEATLSCTAPSNLEAMLKLAETLAAPFGFVRVDLYNIGARLVFSELTFTPLGGALWLTPASWDQELGTRWPQDCLT
jgi:hypothetical protein